MIKEIVKANTEQGLEFLTTKSISSNLKEDKQLYEDLIDTAEHYKDTRIGLAAVQIGVHKRVVIALIGNKFELFINPLIISKSTETYECEEGCLSVDGLRKAKRHKTIELLYTTRSNKVRKQTFTGRVAQILQHEIDHCNGILI